MKQLCGLIFILLFSFVTQSQNGSEFRPYAAYIDGVDEGQNVTIFTKPGLNWATCKKSVDKKTKKEKCIEAVGWPSRDAKIKVISPPVEATVFDPYSEENVVEKYVKVEFDYERVGADGVLHHQKGEGYIELSYLSRSVLNPFYGNQSQRISRQQAEGKIVDCTEENRQKPNNKEKKDQLNASAILDSVKGTSIVQKADQLSGLIGFCPLKPPTKKPDPKDLSKKNENVYDHYILSKLKQVKPPKGLLTEDGRQMTQAQLVEIDAMARTLYGEMAKCFKHGLHYPMAVAKMIKNRSENLQRRAEFIRPPHQNDKPLVSKVATTPTHFSMWLNEINGKRNNSLHHGLCPPQKAGEGFWGSKAASKQENDIWTNALRIATEAVLHPKAFDQKTKEVQGFHYTSGMADKKNSWMKKMTQVNPTILGRKIEKDACLEAWIDKK